MNPLFVIFFTSMFIDDFFFKEGKLTQYTFILIISYWIFYLFIHKSQYHSPHRKILLASYSHSYDCSIYSKINFDVTEAKKFLQEYNENNPDKKISLTLLTAKVIGDTVAKHPDINLAIKFGKLIPRRDSAVGVLVDVKGGKNLAFVTLRQIDTKKLPQLREELYPAMKEIKNEKKEELNKQVNMLKSIPSFILGPLMDFMGFLSNLGVTCKPIGLEKNQFGSFLLTSVGSLGIDSAYAPLCPFTNTVGCLTLGGTKLKRILQKDGTYHEFEQTPLNIVIDHRFLDGVLGAKLLKMLKTSMEDPEVLRSFF